MELSERPIDPDLHRAELLIGVRITDSRKGGHVQQSLEQFTLLVGDTPADHQRVEQLFALLRFEDPDALLAWLVERLVAHQQDGYDVPVLDNGEASS